ncbi:hypothetical protein ACOCJ5_05000 [Knoellia sp. CPCC 206450]|uniref:hypothetical protein n=1 Tax=Knoellia tibetensis TaxID=3404798 RepID=UPI003B43A1EB
MTPIDGADSDIGPIAGARLGFAAAVGLGVGLGLGLAVTFGLGTARTVRVGLGVGVTDGVGVDVVLADVSVAVGDAELGAALGGTSSGLPHA